MAWILRFGVAELDRFTRASAEDVTSQLASAKSSTTAIVGPDGCGKSILALHAASTYYHDAYRHRSNTNCYQMECDARVIYASTDFSSEQARDAWTAFGLNLPGLREKTMRERCLLFDTSENSPDPTGFLTLDFQEIDPSGHCLDHHGDPRKGNSLERILSDKEPFGTLWFLDLQSQTAGDDWTFLNHLVGLLPRRKSSPRCPGHLLVVDAVEGLEAFVGNQDAFGETRTRRSRVAQLVRSCQRAEVHLLFVVEEAKPQERQPEQFISDTVIRLRAATEKDAVLRYLTVEKCRGQSHDMSEHQYSLRSGHGTTTGKSPNLDHPKILWTKGVGKENDNESVLSHMWIAQSINYRNAELRRDAMELPVSVGIPTFGIGGLDEQFEEYHRAQPQTRGLDNVKKHGSLCTLLGETGTHKSQLAQAFLSEAFRDPRDHGVAILITTLFMSQADLIDRMKRHLQVSYKASAHIPNAHVLCRRLSVRHLTSAWFLQTVDSHIKAAQKLLTNNPQLILGDDVRNIEQRRRYSYNIRIVIDDWAALLANHPNMREDALLLPYLVTLLKREGVKSLIVGTQSAHLPSRDLFEPNDLRRLEDHQVVTWSVPFFGQRRIAMTTSAAKAGIEIPEVFELKHTGEALEVDPHFSLYADLAVGRPSRIPLKVRLFSGAVAPSDGSTTGLQKAEFLQSLQNVLSETFPSESHGQVASLQSFESYDEYAAYAEWMDRSRLDHTVVFQIDEFWSEGRQGLAQLTHYWRSAMVSEVTSEPGVAKCESNLKEDPRSLFQPHLTLGGSLEPAAKESVPQITTNYRNKIRDPGKFYRNDFFPQSLLRKDKGSEVDRVPFLWDFGIILADSAEWRKCALQPLRNDDSDVVTVGDIWNSLCLKADKFHEVTAPSRGEGKSRRDVSWIEFFRACDIVAQSARTSAFEVDQTTSETLSCLFLEIWSSLSLWCNSGHVSKSHFGSLTKRVVEGGRGGAPYPVGPSLSRLIDIDRKTLAVACQQLAAGLRGSGIVGSSMRGNQPDRRFVASREWYSTACAFLEGRRNHNYCVLQLPGRFSVRGDWFLAMAAGSRSELLGQRAMDFLLSRRMCLQRLHHGIGLPVRDIAPDAAIGDIRTAIRRNSASAKSSSIVTYDEICSLGAECPENRDAFHWLWRSRIKNYDRDYFYLRRWLDRLISEQGVWLEESDLTFEKQCINQSRCKSATEAGATYPESRHLTRSIALLASTLRNKSIDRSLAIG